MSPRVVPLDDMDLRLDPIQSLPIGLCRAVAKTVTQLVSDIRPGKPPEDETSTEAKPCPGRQVAV